MIITAITIVLILIGLILMYNFDTERESAGFHAFSLISLLVMGIILGAELSTTFTTKYKKKPIVHVECNGSKCDTTYIYKFK
jgi:hypothetical protein